MADPSDLGVLEDLKFITRYDIFPVIAGEYTLRDADREALRSRATTSRSSMTLLKDMEADGRATSRSSRSRRKMTRPRQAQIEDAPVVKLINAILTDAVKRGASRHPLRVRSSTRSACATASTARC